MTTGSTTGTTTGTTTRATVGGAAAGTISVVIPVYNAAQFLSETIASARAQTRPSLEVIVVDDWSTDDTRAIAAALERASRDDGGPPVRVLTTPRNGGPSAARNIGIAAAGGDYVAFLDADDRWRANHLASVAGALDSHPGVVVAFGGVRSTTTMDDPDDARAGEGLLVPPRLHPFPDGEPIDATTALFAENHVPQSAVVARREALVACGGYDESMRMSEDYDMWLRLSLQGAFVRTGAVTADYRMHPGQVSRSEPEMLKSWWKVRDQFVERVASRRPELAEALMPLAFPAWEADARYAWRTGSSPLIRATIAVHERLPGAPALPWRWRWRIHYLWPAWRLIVRVWDALPPGARQALGRLRGR